MSSNSISVTLAMALAPYQKTLASSLMDAHMLGCLLRITPDLNLEVLAPGAGNSLKVTRTFP